VVGDQKHGSAVDAARERDADGRPRVDPREPLGDFVRERFDVTAADLVEIRGQRGALRREKARVRRRRIGTADERQLDDVMRV
jgi:hypothetical protein